MAYQTYTWIYMREGILYVYILQKERKCYEHIYDTVYTTTLGFKVMY